MLNPTNFLGGRRKSCTPTTEYTSLAKNTNKNTNGTKIQKSDGTKKKNKKNGKAGKDTKEKKEKKNLVRDRFTQEQGFIKLLREPHLVMSPFVMEDKKAPRRNGRNASRPAVLLLNLSVKYKNEFPENWRLMIGERVRGRQRLNYMNGDYRTQKSGSESSEMDTSCNSPTSFKAEVDSGTDETKPDNMTDASEKSDNDSDKTDSSRSSIDLTHLVQDSSDSSEIVHIVSEAEPMEFSANVSVNIEKVDDRTNDVSKDDVQAQENSIEGNQHLDVNISDGGIENNSGISGRVSPLHRSNCTHRRKSYQSTLNNLSPPPEDNPRSRASSS